MGFIRHSSASEERLEEQYNRLCMCIAEDCETQNKILNYTVKITGIYTPVEGKTFETVEDLSARVCAQPVAKYIVRGRTNHQS
jgi:dihydroneopterin aldolase